MPWHTTPFLCERKRFRHRLGFVLPYLERLAFRAVSAVSAMPWEVR